MNWQPLRSWYVLYVSLYSSSSNMMISWPGNTFHISALLCRESTVHWWTPLTKFSNVGFVVSFDANQNKMLSKQLSCMWFEMLMWHHHNDSQWYWSSQCDHPFISMKDNMQVDRDSKVLMTMIQLMWQPFLFQQRTIYLEVHLESLNLQ